MNFDSIVSILSERKIVARTVYLGFVTAYLYANFFPDRAETALAVLAPIGVIVAAMIAISALRFVEGLLMIALFFAADIPVALFLHGSKGYAGAYFLDLLFAVPSAILAIVLFIKTRKRDRALAEILCQIDEEPTGAPPS